MIVVLFWPEQVGSPDQGQVACVHVGLVAEGGQVSQVLHQVLQSSDNTQKEISEISSPRQHWSKSLLLISKVQVLIV